MFHCEWGGYRASSSHCDGLCGPPRKNQDFWPPGTPIETSWYQAGPGVRRTNGWPGWATTSLTFACASMKGKSLSDPDNYPSMNTMLTSRSFMSFTVATGTAINVGWLPKSSYWACPYWNSIWRKDWWSLTFTEQFSGNLIHSLNPSLTLYPPLIMSPMWTLGDMAKLVGNAGVGHFIMDVAHH